jgi:glutamate N-acetyltransferase/amino-acid N-acetyltransferase
MPHDEWFLAPGFRYAGIHCGLRPDPERRDLAVIVTDGPAAAAGVFTQNRVVAAPVQVCRTRVPAGAVRGIVICSGNANACTGEQGLADARRMAAVLAGRLETEPANVLVCSTGIIGRPLPMNVIEPGIARAVAELRSDAEGLEAAARAILTTDTVIKVATLSVTDGPAGTAPYRLTGFAKGAAMIGPDLATMLGFVLTDAVVTPTDLQPLLKRACDRSFNCISVEGHESTNDTVLLLATGHAGGPPLAGKALVHFEAAVTAVCEKLAMDIVRDAEGASHVLALSVEGLRTEEEARRVAKAVAESALVKTAIFGADPNWGRIVSAAGYAGVAFAERDLSLWLGDTLLYDAGTPVPFDAAGVSAYMKANRDLHARLVFTLGNARCRFWTSDLTYEYVRLNAEYTT